MSQSLELIEHKLSKSNHKVSDIHQPMVCLVQKHTVQFIFIITIHPANMMFFIFSYFLVYVYVACPCACMPVCMCVVAHVKVCMEQEYIWSPQTNIGISLSSFHLVY